jgi:hypothetical protein
MVRLLLAFAPVALFAIAIRLIAGHLTARAKQSAGPPPHGASGNLSRP